MAKKRPFLRFVVRLRLIATNSRHAEILLLSPRFRRDQFQTRADAIVRVLEQYLAGLADLIVYIRRH